MDKNAQGVHQRIDQRHCHLVFFDLEYYVPNGNRLKDHYGLQYDPSVNNNLLLGGNVCCLKVEQLEEHPFEMSSIKMTSHWLWNLKNEREVVQSIFKQLSTILKQSKRQSRRYYPLICGIGIIHSDWPALLHLFVKHGCMKPGDIFRFQNRFRTLDLQLLTIPFYNSKRMHLYPKAKNEMLQKFLGSVPMEDGKLIWDLYEQKNFKLIEERVRLEVCNTIIIYQEVHNQIKKLSMLRKKQDKTDKK